MNKNNVQKDIYVIEKIKNIISSRTKKTNCFSFYNKICDWIEKDMAYFYLVDSCLFILYKANGFYKFYYYVDDFESIKLAKNLLDEYREESEISLEFTTKHNKFLQDIKEQIYSIGFEFYAEYVRLISSKENKLNQNEQSNFELATSIDKKELLDIMHREFDKIKDDIPTDKELQELIDKESILIKKVENEIVYIQIYEYFNGVLYGKMRWIKKEFRKPKYTVEFFSGDASYIKKLNIKNKNIREYFWVDTSIKQYKLSLKLGAIPDGISSNIFVYKNKLKG